MPLSENIAKQQQKISRLEKSLSLEKIKSRKLDTRKKIELGGLVIKSGLDGFNKSVLLGALDHSLKLIQQDPSYTTLFESIGDNLFLEK